MDPNLSDDELDAIRRAIADGETSGASLTDLIFFARHPERDGRRLEPDEPDFAALSVEWWAIRRAVTVWRRGAPIAIFDRFEIDRAELGVLHLRDLRILADHLGVLAQVGTVREVRLIGHADTTGDDEHNLTLGMQRAVAVRDELKRVMADPSVEVTADTAGEEEPLTSERTDEDRAMNRRVEAFLIYLPRPVPPVSFEDCVRHARQALDAADDLEPGEDPIPPNQLDRLRCVVSKFEDGGDVDDRVVIFNSLWAYEGIITPGMRPAMWDLILGSYRHSIERLTPDVPLRRVRSSLVTIDTQVHKAIAHLAFKHAVDDVGIATGIVQVKDWVARQQRDQSSVYSCYR